MKEKIALFAVFFYLIFPAGDMIIRFYFEIIFFLVALFLSLVVKKEKIRLPFLLLILIVSLWVNIICTALLEYKVEALIDLIETVRFISPILFLILFRRILCYELTINVILIISVVNCIIGLMLFFNINFFSIKEFLLMFFYNRSAEVFLKVKIASIWNTGATNGLVSMMNLFFIFLCSSDIKMKKPLYLILVATNLTTLLISQSKTAWIIFAVLINFYFIAEMFFEKKVPFRLTLAFLIITILFFSNLNWLQSTFLNARKLFLTESIIEISSFQARIYNWKEFLDVLLERSDSFIFGVSRANTKLKSTFDNDLLYVVIKFGLTGLLIALFLFGKEFKKIFIYSQLNLQKKKNLILTGVMFLSGSALGCFTVPQISAYYFFLISTDNVLLLKEKEEDSLSRQL